MDCQCSQCPGKMMFTASLSNNTRGHSKKLQLQKATGLRHNFFSTRVVNLWNKLNEATVSSNSINSFKNNLKNDIGTTMFDYTFSY